jgi:hypothetical protein
VLLLKMYALKKYVHLHIAGAVLAPQLDTKLPEGL